MALPEEWEYKREREEPIKYERKEVQSVEDRALIKRIKQGDKAAFEQLVNKHYRNIFAYCYRRTGSKEDAEDITQEVFLKLVKAIYKYQHTGKFTNFIFTIAVNCCNDFFRSKARHEMKENISDDVAQLVAGARDEPENRISCQEEKDILYHRLKDLNSHQKEALILYYFHQLKAREIAQITGVPLATAKSRIRQGMEHLRKTYTNEDGQPKKPEKPEKEKEKKRKEALQNE